MMNQKYWCATCNTGHMATKEQLDNHLSSQKHIKKAFHLGVDVKWDGHSPKNMSNSNTIIVNQFNVPSMNSDQDFPSLGGSSVPAPGFGRGRCLTTSQNPLQLKSSFNATDKSDFPGLGSSTGQSCNANQPTVSYGAAAASGISNNPAPVSQIMHHANIPRESERENLSYRMGNVQLVSNDQYSSSKSRIKDDYEKRPTALRILKEYENKSKTPAQAYEEISKCMRWSVLLEECAPINMPYAMKIILNGREIGKGEGKKKMDAKHKAAQQALREVKRILKDMDNDDDDACSVMSLGNNKRNPADEYADITDQFISRLLKQVKGLDKPSAYATFIITTRHDQPASKGVIVAVGTGRDISRLPKTVLFDDNGFHLIDMQSLTMARRALQCFLWSQINRLFTESDTSPLAGDSTSVPLFFDIDAKGWIVLKPEHRLHLFMSHAPAGDATCFISDKFVEPDILPDSEMKRDDSGKLMPKPHSVRLEAGRPFLGMLRIMEGVERDLTMPVNFTGGILLTNTANVASPSDKLMRWIHVGLQGSLLSHFMKPLFLYSIQVGCQYDHGSMARALMTRVNLTYLTGNSDEYSPESRVDPFITRTKHLRSYPRAERKISWSWFLKNRPPSNHGVEVVSTETGLITAEFDHQKEFGDSNSQLSRLSMLTRFEMVSKVADNFFSTKPVLSRGRDLRAVMQAVDLEYFSLKKLATNYQVAKENLLTALKSEGLGEWPANTERKSFYLYDDNGQ